MDPIKNPFYPGAGSPPPALVGRAPIIEQARILLGMTYSPAYGDLAFTVPLFNEFMGRVIPKFKP